MPQMLILDRHINVHFHVCVPVGGEGVQQLAFLCGSQSFAFWTSWPIIALGSFSYA